MNAGDAVINGFQEELRLWFPKHQSLRKLKNRESALCVNPLIGIDQGVIKELVGHESAIDFQA
jgi:hypothetical protein